MHANARLKLLEGQLANLRKVSQGLAKLRPAITHYASAMPFSESPRSAAEAESGSLDVGKCRQVASKKIQNDNRARAEGLRTLGQFFLFFGIVPFAPSALRPNIWDNVPTSYFRHLF